MFSFSFTSDWTKRRAELFPIKENNKTTKQSRIEGQSPLCPVSSSSLLRLISSSRTQFPASLTVKTPKLNRNLLLMRDLLCAGWNISPPLILLFLKKSLAASPCGKALVELMEHGVWVLECVSSWRSAQRCLGPSRLWTSCLLFAASRRLPTRVFLPCAQQTCVRP